DGESKTYTSNGLFCENYHCYNKPILAPADGIVEEIVDNVDDNEIGNVNTLNNWGNSIIIRHLPGLYTQLSHLKKGSFKVGKGDFVKRGDLVASCGNSGRSPEPHLHFQVQTTPVLGSRTIDYPFAYYYEKNNGERQMKQFAKPPDGALVSGVNSDQLLKSAFDIIPNTVLKYSYENEKGIEKVEQWESYTDAYNYKYLYCKETESSAYYVNDGFMFYFTAFYGNKDSLLYYFYLSAYKVFLGDPENTEMNDALPLSVIRNKKISIWLQDFIAPFHNYIHVRYSIQPEYTNNLLDAETLILKSKIQASVFGRIRNESNSKIILSENCIKEFTYKSNKIKIQAKCINS
ncbi:MAG TPA: M23 family metallopeptidase, partial [Prolixibacteraceae bacterium]